MRIRRCRTYSPAIVINGCRFNDGINRIPVAACLIQCFQQHNAYAFAEHDSAAPFIEDVEGRPLGQNPPLSEHSVSVLRIQQADPAYDRCFYLAAVKRLNRHIHADQSGRASGINDDTRAPQIEEL
ncbi:hypothetical protein D3C85_1575240 [compost metagenome]